MGNDASATLVFPSDRAEIRAMKDGRRCDAVVPIPPGNPLKNGDRVTFAEATKNPLIDPIILQEGESFTAELKSVRDERYRWAGQDLFYIAWDPPEVGARAADAASLAGGD